MLLFVQSSAMSFCTGGKTNNNNKKELKSEFINENLKKVWWSWGVALERGGEWVLQKYQQYVEIIIHWKGAFFCIFIPPSVCCRYQQQHNITQTVWVGMVTGSKRGEGGGFWNSAGPWEWDHGISQLLLLFCA